MIPPTLPTWWPPSRYGDNTDAQVRELFAYLRTVVPPVMAEALRWIQARVGDDRLGDRTSMLVPLLRRCAL